MRALYPDWRAPGLTVCLHERAGGYAFNRESMLGLADKARAAGARIAEGVEVTGFEFDGSGRGDTRAHQRRAPSRSSRSSSPSARGSRRCGRCSACPTTSTCASPTARSHANLPMWTYWYLQEGEVDVDPAVFVTADGRSSPVLHVDSDQPLRDDDGRLITDRALGRLLQARPHNGPGRRPAADRRAGVRGRPVPDRHASSRASRTCGRAALSHCLERFEGCREKFRAVRSGGVGAFTVDNFPVFDYMRPNVFVAADSNHGYKMIAVGREVARVLQGEHSSLLHPFRYERFADRGPAPGLAQPVPLELNGAGPAEQAPDLAGGSPQRPLERPPLGHRQAARRPLQPDDRDELVGPSDHRRGHPREIGLALADRLGDSALTNQSQLAAPGRRGR